MSCISNSSDINQTFIIEPLAIDDIYTTGATLIDSVIYFNRTDILSAYTVNLTSFVTTDTYVTGMTFSNNTLTATRNDGVNISANINTLTGLTVNGSLSATTFYGNGSHLTGISTGDTYVTGVTFTSNTLTITTNDGNDVSTNINSFTGLTVNGSLTATTLYGDGSHLTGISTGETYTNAALTPAPLGGIGQNSTFLNRTMTEMWTDLLYPYQTPAFTAFTRTVLSTDYDLGQPVSAGSQTFTWLTTYSANVITNSISIDQLYPSTLNILTGATNDNIQVINLTGRPIISATTVVTLPIYRITATNSNLLEFTSTISRTWKNRWYYGKNANTSLTAAQITGLTNSALVTNVTGGYVTFASGAEYLYMAIPKGLAQPYDWRDSTSGCNGNNVPYSLLPGTGTTVTNKYGVSTVYNVYRSTNTVAGVQIVWICPTP